MTGARPHFTTNNTDGYTLDELTLLNDRYEELTEGLNWHDHPQSMQGISERVLREHDSEGSRWQS